MLNSTNHRYCFALFMSIFWMLTASCNSDAPNMQPSTSKTSNTSKTTVPDDWDYSQSLGESGKRETSPELEDDSENDTEPEQNASDPHTPDLPSDDPCISALSHPVVFTQVSAGYAHSLAITDNGELFAWGNNDYGQLGLGDTTPYNEPTRVSALDGEEVIAVASSYWSSMALTNNGELFTWGRNQHGQLGHQDIAERHEPTKVTLPEDAPIGVIAAGANHKMAITNNGELFVWGDNSNGHLMGFGGIDEDILAPERLQLPDGVTLQSAAAGFSHSLALTNNGELFAWGLDVNGQLGLGEDNPSPLDPLGPTKITTFDGEVIVAVASGGLHNLAITNNGELFAWGDNTFGQLGEGDNPTDPLPTLVSALSDVSIEKIAAGPVQSFAIANTGELFAWGHNDKGQLGHGDTASYIGPTQVSALSDKVVTDVATGNTHGVSVTQEGEVFSWGANDDGQLGLGTNDSHTAPEQVLAPTPLAEPDEDDC